MPILLLLWTLLTPKEECWLKVSPNITQEPLKFLHFTVHIDDPKKWWIGTIFIVEEEGEITRHQLFEGDMAQYQPKTITEDWKSLTLFSGDYEVQLVVANREGERCVAKQPLKVVESQ